MINNPNAFTETGWKKIATTILTAAAGAISFTGINSALYNEFMVVGKIYSGGNDAAMGIQINGDGAANYRYTGVQADSAAGVVSEFNGGAGTGALAGVYTQNGKTAGFTAFFSAFNAATTGVSYRLYGGKIGTNALGESKVRCINGTYSAAAAVTRIDFLSGNGNWSTGSEIALMGRLIA